MSKIRRGLVRTGLVGTIALATAFAVTAGDAHALPVAPPASTAGEHNGPPGGAHAACAKGRVKDGRGDLKYRACKRGEVIRISGTLNDKRHDKRCLRAKIRFTPSGPVSWYKDCGGRPTRFDTGWQRAENGHLTLH